MRTITFKLKAFLELRKSESGQVKVSSQRKKSVIVPEPGAKCWELGSRVKISRIDISLGYDLRTDQMKTWNRWGFES